jgi:hypothetical protein
MARGTLLSGWTLPHGVNLALMVLLTVTLWTLLWQGPVVGKKGFGGDFRQFYTAGWIANYGDIGQLYDQTYFRGVERKFWGDGKWSYSLYPPMMALAVSPLARLPLTAATSIWWALQVVCLLATGWMLYVAFPIAPQWRKTAMFALVCTFPLWVAIAIAHLTPMLLVVLTAGLTLHLRGRRVLAGCVLSLLAIKPQFAAAICLWLLLRRDVRTSCGMLIGLFVQALVVSAGLGPSVIVDYLNHFPEMTQKVKDKMYSPSWEQSFAGILGYRLWNLDLDPRDYGNAFLLTQLVAAGVAGFLLFQIVQANRQLQRLGRNVPFGPWYERGAVVLFMLLLTPYLLVYDLTLLAIPIVCLWASPGWRMGVVLWVLTTLVFALLYQGLGFSLVPFVELIVLARMAALLRSLVFAEQLPRPHPSLQAFGVRPT